ncbi:Trm112-like [Dillenia turbinata]|uniref:Trm112-like n=1 Tax=Dillenia turbinata TaxID=194707 RepID=A0AAN8YU44_9MAGN
MEKQVDFNADFLRNMFPKIEWKALVEASRSMGYTELPDEADSSLLDSHDFLQKFHHALLELHLEEGALVCPETGRKFPVNKGIPNMLLHEDECELPSKCAPGAKTDIDELFSFINDCRRFVSGGDDAVHGEARNLLTDEGTELLENALREGNCDGFSKEEKNEVVGNHENGDGLRTAMGVEKFLTFKVSHDTYPVKIAIPKFEVLQPSEKFSAFPSNLDYHKLRTPTGAVLLGIAWK